MQPPANHLTGFAVTATRGPRKPARRASWTQLGTTGPEHTATLGPLGAATGAVSPWTDWPVTHREGERGEARSWKRQEPRPHGGGPLPPFLFA